MRERKSKHRTLVNRLKDWLLTRRPSDVPRAGHDKRSDSSEPEGMIETGAVGLAQTIESKRIDAPLNPKTIGNANTVLDASATKQHASSDGEQPSSNLTNLSGKTSFESKTLQDSRDEVPKSDSGEDQTIQFASSEESPALSRPIASENFHEPTKFEDSNSRNENVVQNESHHELNVGEVGEPILSDSIHVCVKKHAEGGLGAVYLALDEKLQRSVAFKEIKGGHAANREANDRFLFEAQVAARLEHPSIVPVYSQGQHGDGRPFYTMRFVNGDTLDMSIKRLHSVRDKTLRHEWVDQLKELVWRFTSACQAISYAHSQGYIHRDIKPQNIMLGKFGETLVVDWGLAKCITPDFSVPQPVSRADEKSLEVDTLDVGESVPLQAGNSSVSHPSMTPSPHSVEGRAAGTPSFMSPEQMEGRIDDLDSRSDVFSLGCTLYTIVTGELPFVGKTLGEISTKVRQNDYRQPRSANPLVPAPLAAICIRAMEHQPQDRYQSVQLLIEDIEHWMSDRRVSAYQEPFVQRSQRWFRRHKTLATMLAVGMALILLFTSVALVIVNAEKKQTSLALDRERVAKQQTQAALDTVTDDLLGELMARQESLTATDRQFFNRIVDQYDRLVAPGGKTANDPSLESIRGRAGGHLQVANLRRRLGDYELAETGFLTAIEQYRGLQDSNSSSESSGELETRLAQAYSNYGLLLADTGRYELALENYESAMRLLFDSASGSNIRMSAISTSAGSNLPVSNEVAKQRIQWCNVASNAANMKWRLGELAPASELYQESIDWLTEIAAHSDEAIRRSASLSEMQVRFNYGQLLVSQPERIDEAKDCLESAVGIWERLKSTGAVGESGAEVEAAGRLAPASRLAGTATRTGLAKVLLKQRDVSGAIKQLEKTVGEQEQLVSEYPGFASYQLQLARSQMQLGKCLAAIKSQDASTRLVESEKMLKLLAQRFPERPNYQIEYANALELVSGTSLAKQSGEVVSRLTESLDVRRSLLESDTKSEIYLRGLLKTQLRIANRFRLTADYPSAIVGYQDLLGTIEEHQQQPDSPFLKDVFDKARFGLADSFSKSKRYSEALSLWQQLAANSEDPNWRHFELQRIIGLIRTEKFEEGGAALDAFVALGTEEDPLSGVNHYDVACCFSIVAELSEPDREKACQRSLEALRTASKLGFFQDKSMRDHFSSDGDLLGVSKYEEFREFLAETELIYQPGSEEQ